MIVILPTLRSLISISSSDIPFYSGNAIWASRAIKFAICELGPLSASDPKETPRIYDAAQDGERSGHFRQTSSGEVNFQTSVSRASRNNLASSRVCSAGDDVTKRCRNSATVKGSSQRKYGTTEGSVRSVERETLITFSPLRFDDRPDYSPNCRRYSCAVRPRSTRCARSPSPALR